MGIGPDFSGHGRENPSTGMLILSRCVPQSMGLERFSLLILGYSMGGFAGRKPRENWKWMPVAGALPRRELRCLTLVASGFMRIVYPAHARKLVEDWEVVTSLWSDVLEAHDPVLRRILAWVNGTLNITPPACFPVQPSVSERSAPGVRDSRRIMYSPGCTGACSCFPDYRLYRCVENCGASCRSCAASAMPELGPVLIRSGAESSGCRQIFGLSWTWRAAAFAARRVRCSVARLSVLLVLLLTAVEPARFFLCPEPSRASPHLAVADSRCGPHVFR